MRLERFAGQKVAILGYGREGRSAQAALDRVNPAPSVTVWAESGDLPDLVNSRRRPFDEDLQDFDIVVRSPGIPVDHPALVAYRAAGGQVVNPSSIWLHERPELTVVAVTGSKGKSTTASLLAHLLRAKGESVLLAGNIGVPLLDHLDTRASLVVLELSSYQLADLEGQLHMGLITRLFPEHLDWHGSERAYFACKLRLADLLRGKPLLINACDPILCLATAAIPGRVEANCAPGFHRRDDFIDLDQAPLIASSELNLVGRHNLDNIALALEAACMLGAELEELVKVLRSFRPLAHRLETVVTAHGRRWINDSIATSPYATRAALESLAQAQVTLIAGGQQRPADWAPVIDWCRSHPLSALVVLPDNGPAVAARLREASAVESGNFHEATDLNDAVAAAIGLSEPGSTVLLSPGAPSFPHYRNFEDRGDRFRSAIAAYRDRSTA